MINGSLHIINKFGKSIVTIFVTALMVFISISITFIDSLLFNHDLIPGLYLSGLIPLVLAPPTILILITIVMKLDRVERETKTVIENASDAFFIHDHTGGIIEVNDTACMALGYSREELLTLHVSDIEVGYDPERLAKHWDELVQGTALTLEGEHRRKDGVTFPVEVRVSVMDYDNEFRILALARDITKRKISESALRKSEEKYRNLVETSHDLIWSVDGQGKFTFVNQASRFTHGYEPNEMIGRPFTDFMTTEQAEIDIAVFAKIKDGRNYFDLETVHLKKDGSPVNLSFNAVVMRDDNGEVLGTTGTAQDITVRKKAEDALHQAKELAEQANITKSKFLTNISHELRTPLNAILGYGQLLKENPKEMLSSAQEKHIEKLLGSGRHLTDLINDILDLTKFEAGILKISSESVALQDVIAESTSVVDELLQSADINLIWNAPEQKLPEIWVDRVRIRQALVNILSNAIKYNQKHGEIILNAKLLEEGLLRISVTDTGTGIPEERRNEIYLPFTRLIENDAEIPGTGIGLTITKHLIEAMGGNIDFESSASGSTFWIDLPTVEVAETTEAQLSG